MRYTEGPVRYTEGPVVNGWRDPSIFLIAQVIEIILLARRSVFCIIHGVIEYWSVMQHVFFNVLSNCPVNYRKYTQNTG